MKENKWKFVPMADTDDLKKHNIYRYGCPYCEWEISFIDSNPQEYTMNYCPCCGEHLISEPEENNEEI